ncbi:MULTISPECIES: hypothetical protein [Pannonibacter]|uniref:hypothetical protein n=1 Tax=Pannonibacter TaxID=227873 RepID=UPI0013CE4B66|nr:hypothetical protein [Pannonibacter phragmitetus]
MPSIEVFWNAFALEEYIVRLERLPASQAAQTHKAVQAILRKLSATPLLYPFHDKDRGIRKINRFGETVLFIAHEGHVEVLGVFPERSNWMTRFPN